MHADFAEKNRSRGERQARSCAIGITRTHKKIHLGKSTREEGSGAKAPGVLVKTGVRTSQPADANWRKMKSNTEAFLCSC